MIVVTSDKIPKTGLDLLKNYTDDLIIFDDNIPETKKLKYIVEADAILSLLRDKFPSDLIKQCKNLKVISNYAVGYDNIDIKAASELGVKVCNTPGVLTETTADLAFAIMLAAARKVCSSQAFLRKGKYHGWEPDLFLGYDVYGKTLGIIGAGKIGQAIARRATGFSMKILYYKRSRNIDFEKQTGAIYSDMDSILRLSDFISINTPLTDETYHMIDKKEFEIMRSNVIIVNTSRGATINEHALIEALKENRIAGCALDVFEFEPKVSDELLDFENIILTPHIGSASFETREKMAEMAADNIIKVLSSKHCENIVNDDGGNNE